MCYSPEVSLFTFSICLGFSILLFFNNNPFHKLLGLFLGFVSLMQGIEYLLWTFQECNSFHKNISVIGMILNHLQPVILALVTGSIYRKNIPILLLISLFYLAIIIPYSLQFTRDLHCTQPQCGNPHLIWNWNILPYSSPVYIIFLASFILIARFGMPDVEGILFATGALISYISSSLLYSRNTMGALWCFWTAFAPAAIYLNSQFQLISTI
jgi:hypothetical protein